MSADTLRESTCAVALVSHKYDLVRQDKQTLMHPFLLPSRKVLVPDRQHSLDDSRLYAVLFW